MPILGPVDHEELLYSKETARRALFNYTASRNFRNIWHHFPENFDKFRAALAETWPGMDIEPPQISHSPGKPKLYMFCPEERIPREICWAGFGFQVWCQMLTHLIQSSERALFLIDEPEIYLHPELQRQLLGLLRNLGPDIIIATHSTEIITEAEPDDIVLIDKRRRSASRLKNTSQLVDVFSRLGSNLNPILTQLAKTSRAVFVEGKDFQIISRFGQRLKLPNVSTRSKFAVVPIDGFNPQRMRNLKLGIEVALGGTIHATAILDRDFRSESECEAITGECKSFCNHVVVHTRKEIENFLLVPSAIDRAATKKLVDHARRSGGKARYSCSAREILEEFASREKDGVMALHISERRRFERTADPKKHDSAVTKAALIEFNASWQTFDSRMALIPGKAALSYFNRKLQESHSISLTPSLIIDAMEDDEIPTEARRLIDLIDRFAGESIRS